MDLEQGNTSFRIILALLIDVVFRVGTSGIQSPGPAKRPKRGRVNSIQKIKRIKCSII